MSSADLIESEHNNLSMQQHREMKINESMINRGITTPQHFRDEDESAFNQKSIESKQFTQVNNLADRG